MDAGLCARAHPPTHTHTHTRTLEVVVVGILSHSAVDEGPGEVVHCILLVLNRLGHHLCVEVVVEEVIQVGLREGGMTSSYVRALAGRLGMKSYCACFQAWERG